jgi:hypothetical protein
MVGDDSSATNVVVEMGGTLTWQARRGFIEGVTLRRPKIASSSSPMRVVPKPLVRVEGAGRVKLVECCFDNGGKAGPVVSLEGPGMKGLWDRVLIKGGTGGIALGEAASLELISVRSRS